MASQLRPAGHDAAELVGDVRGQPVRCSASSCNAGSCSPVATRAYPRRCPIALSMSETPDSVLRALRLSVTDFGHCQLGFQGGPMSIKSRRFRPSRSIFQMTSVSPDRKSSMHRIHCGRSALVPVAVSV